MTVRGGSNGPPKGGRDGAPPTAEDFDELVTRVALELGDVDRSDVVSGTELRVGDRPFAVFGPGRLEVLLDRNVAAAALRTPDVAASERAPGWVAFTPAPGAVDRFALDRAEAWLRSAHRLAAARRT